MDELNQKVYDKAIKLIQIRLHTTGELLRKLKQRGFKDKDVRPVLKRLEELRFLDDERFAQIFVDNLKRYKDWGYYGIKAKLLVRQIPRETAEAALQEFFTLEDEETVARRFIGKLKRQGRKDFEKLMRSLNSKGFRSDVIRKIVSP